MHSIVKASAENYILISELAAQTFIESHGSSATEEDINTYVAEKYNAEALKSELENPGNIYHIIYHNGKAAGFSKIILNFPFAGSKEKNITKLERIYLLTEFYKLNLGLALFNYNIDLMKQNNQAGVWLFVWKENYRAIKFYEKNDFKIIGSYDFKISETHSNPNHQMLLLF